MKKPLGFLTLLFSLLPFVTVAQEAPISADGTTATDVNSADGSNFDINGGDRAGGNLFHSFGNFSVPNSGSANFLNSPDVQNIINRVTGGKISDIQGLIKANGTANLFLINPAGIVFGENASLNIGGSFLGSTADRLIFPDGEFSAVNAEGKPLLTINAPIGLGIRDNPGNITTTNTLLEVDPGKSIALIGGNLSINGGFIVAPGGIVGLGGLTSAGEIKLNPDGNLSVTEGATRGDVSITNGAEVVVNSSGGGTIFVNAKDLKLSNSSLFAQIDADFGETEPLGGNINIDTTGSVLLDNSTLNNSTFIEGDSGKISIEAKGAVNLSNSAIFNNVNSTAIGNVGGVTIKAGSFSLEGDRSGILSGTAGKGNAGNISISTDGVVNLSGGDILSVVASTGVGNAGNITINAQELSLKDGAQLLSRVEDRAENNSSTENTEAGNIEINVGGSFNLAGVGDDDFPSRINSSLGEGRQGKAGDINIKAGSLSLADGAFINSSTAGIGKAGNINITANSLTLDRSNIFASNVSTISGSTDPIQGSNITINFKDILKLKNDSLISAEATGNASGGNIKIDAEDGFIVAKPNLDNDIIATAVKGRGGNINIDVERVYGFDRNRIQNLSAIQLGEDLINNGKNDINSSSGNPTTPGNVEINTDAIDPGKERVNTAAQVIEPDDTVAQACSGSADIANENSFTIVGRGGFPSDPTKPLNSSIFAGNLKAEGPRSRGVEEKKTLSSDEIIPARGVAVNEKGQVVLTRYPTPKTGDRPLVQSDYCTGGSSYLKYVENCIKMYNTYITALNCS
jgi:filamentous hemagglutinin family protein